MASDAQVNRLKHSVKKWNEWRVRTRSTKIDLSDANLNKLDLVGANLHDANLSNALLSGVNLEEANLVGADLNGAVLPEACLEYTDLSYADLSNSNLVEANLTNARLFHTNLSFADLTGARLFRAALYWTLFNGSSLEKVNFVEAEILEAIFVDVDLSRSVGLEFCSYQGPSFIDYATLQKSDSLPLPFLRGIGLPESVIEYLPSLRHRAIELFSCFISYSSRDQEFASRLHSDLQSKGVRCWFAPHDMPIGGKILDEIDSAIRLRDKVLLILSEHSIKSDWVEDEVTKAFEEERKRGQTVLFPIRLDDAVMETNEAWAAKLRARHIGDFRRWKEHDEYQKSFARVLRDLTVKKSG